MTNPLDSFFGAMSDPTRRAVIERLASGPASVSELHAPHKTVLQGKVKDGHVYDLVVTPEFRRKDIVFWNAQTTN